MSAGLSPTMTRKRAHPPTPVLLRWPVFVPLALLVAAGVWMAAGTWLSQRTVSFDITVERAGPCWALEWQRAGSEETNGVWLDLGDEYAEPETLGIRPAGKAADSTGNAELWLYSVTPVRAGAPTVDLKAALRAATPGDLQGNWLPFDSGPGIVYSDAGPGLLRLKVPAGGIVLHMAKTALGGRAVIAYADDSEEIDLHAPATESFQLTLRRRTVPTGTPIHVVRSLPHYHVSSLALRWQDATGTAVVISDATLTQSVFGFCVKSHALRPTGDGCVPASAEQATRCDIRSDAPSGTVEFRGSTDVGRTVHVIGALGLWVVLLVARLVGGLLVTVRRFIRNWGPILDGAAAALVIIAHLGMAYWAPFLLTNDSIDYVGDAAALVDTGSLAHFGFYRTPGYSVFIAPFLLLFRDFATALGYAQAVLGILTAYFVYRILREVLPRPWPALGMLLIGLDPVLLTYERYALSESPATFCVALAAWLLVWQTVQHRITVLSAGRILFAALAMGVVCGLAVYLRPNLQILILFIPLFLVWSCWRVGVRGRVLAQGALTLAIAVACVAPWFVRNRAPAGRPQLTFGAQANRLGGLWNFDAADINQTGVISYDLWKELRQKQAMGNLSVYDVVPAIVGSPALYRQPTLAEAAQWEQTYDRTAREAVAREPGKALRAMGIALASQLGLWPRFEHPSAAENMAWSAPLRGEPGLGPTNFPAVRAEHWHSTRISALAHRSERSIAYVRDSNAARWFNELFWAYRQARPVLAVLFLAGLALALAARVRPLAAIGLLALGNALALAVLVFSPIDRYSAPFQPLIVVLAIYGASRLVSGWTGRSTAARV